MLDWEGFATYLGYSSVKEMLEAEVGQDRTAKFAKHNVTTFAKKLGISAPSLRWKMQELGVQTPPAGVKFTFYPERFGYPSEQAMFQCFRFDERMTVPQIQKELRSKIKEHPIRKQTIRKRLKQYKCLNGVERNLIYHRDRTWSWRKLCPRCGHITVLNAYSDSRGTTGSHCPKCDWETPRDNTNEQEHEKFSGEALL